MQHFMACTFNAYFDRIHAAEMVCNAEIHTAQYKVMASYFLQSYNFFTSLLTLQITSLILTTVNRAVNRVALVCSQWFSGLMEVILMQQMAFLRRSRILFVYALLLKLIMTGVWSYLCSHAGTTRVIWFKWRSDSCFCWDNLFFECTHSPQAVKLFTSILFNDIIQWLLPGLNKGVIHVYFSILQYTLSPISSFLLWNLFKDWSWCGHQRLLVYAGLTELMLCGNWMFV